MATYGGDTTASSYKPGGDLGNDTYYFEIDSKSGRITVYEKDRESVILGPGGGSITTFTNTKIGTLDPNTTEFKFDSFATNDEKKFFSSARNQAVLRDNGIDVLAKGLEKDDGKSSADATILAQRTVSGRDVNFDTSEGVTTFDDLNARDGDPNKNVNVIARDIYPILTYPEKLDTTKQDVIQFTLKELSKVTFSGTVGEKAITKEYANLTGSVTLPIQPAISDSNTVKWGESELNPIQAAAFGASLNAMSALTAEDIINRLGKSMTSAYEKFINNKSYKQALLSYFAQQAVGSQGLISRTTGRVLNPNLELLFQGPALRPFTFQFKLSPRSSDEAKIVKQIIRFFKQAMSVKTTSSSVFLKSPHVFDIRYLSNGDDHKSLNRIKTCALLGCDVDYTPDGSYMTFNDTEKTMTSYGLTLRFNELEPIYDSDYNTGSGADGTTNIHTNITKDEIGF